MDHKAKDKKIKDGFFEAAAFAAFSPAFFIVFGKLLISGSATLVHDHLYWGYPVYQYYAQSILNGNVPLWDPFTLGGEPTCPILFVSRLINPLPLLVTVIGSTFTRDAVILYNWVIIVECFAMLSGVYLVCRMFAHKLYARIILIPVVFFSSLLFFSFRQVAGLNHMMFVPFVFYFILKIIYLKDQRWHNWIFAALFIGLNWESYYFAGAWIFLLAMTASLMIFRRDLISELLKSPGVWKKAAVFSAVIVLTMFPNFVVYKESGKFLYPARQMPKTADLLREGEDMAKSDPNGTDGLFMSYSRIIKTGAHSSIWDIVQAVSPAGNWGLYRSKRWAAENHKTWGDPSEAYLYIGVLPLFIAILGMTMGRHDLKKPLLFMAAVFWVLSLGPAGGLHRVLYYVYPPLWVMRNTHGLSVFFVFMLLIFFSIGMGRLIDNNGEPRLTIFQGRIKTAALSAVMAAVIYASFHIATELIVIDKHNEYTFIVIAACLMAGWIIKRIGGVECLFWGAVMGIALFASMKSNNLPVVALKIALFASPVVIFAAVSRGEMSNKIKAAALILCSLSVLMDITLHARAASFLYDENPRFDVAYGISTEVQSPRFPEYRQAFHKTYMGHDGDLLRYVSQMTNKPYMFTAPESMKPVWIDKIPPGVEITSSVLPNGSFEQWHEIFPNAWLPAGFSYDPGLGEWAIAPNNIEEGVKNGAASMLVNPVKAGDSVVSFLMDSRSYAGKSVMFTVLVRTENTVAGAVKLRLETGDGYVDDYSYQNTGKWERVYVESPVAEKTGRLVISMIAGRGADNFAVFDDLRVYSREPSADILYALGNKQITYFQMLKKYFMLVHNSGMPPEALAEMFAIMQDPIQFKTGALLIDAGKIEERFRGVNPGRLAELLKDRILIEETEAKGLEDAFVMPQPEYEGFMADGGKSGSHAFDYAIESYDFNRLILDVNTDKDGFLYWADGYDEYWHAYVDGAEVPIYRANVNFKAIRINQGGHKVEFVYRPVLFLVSIAVFYAVIIASLAAGVLFYVKSRKNN